MKLISKLIFIFIFFTFYGLRFTDYVFAENKNIFGLHLTQPQDIFQAKNIINSSGGDWGWVTLVIRLDQLDPNSWQDFFNNCRKFHLIPIVRLATYNQGSDWKRPSLSDIDSLATFLNSLNWPTTQRHVIVFNEINHAQEWGGQVDIKNFTDISIYSYQKFKSLNPNFVVISSPLDLAAPESPPDFKSADNVFREIYLYKSEYFDNLDALGSHSYPNHGFIGTPNDTGQHSIRGYQWELEYIRKIGVKKTYPVFITETGWPHKEGEDTRNGFYTTRTTSAFLIDALKIWQSDPKIIAITPFIFNYPNTPFDHFSWVDKSENLYPEYQKVVDLSKVKNSPAQLNQYLATNIHLPLLIFTGNQYRGQITLKNTGESIWGETVFCLKPQTTQNVTLDQICTGNQIVEPGKLQNFDFNFTLSTNTDAPVKTFISWENLPSYEIASILEGSSIYRPKASLKDMFYNFIWEIFK